MFNDDVKVEEQAQSTHAVYDVKHTNNSIVIKGWVDSSMIEDDIKSLTLKKRGAPNYYTIPFEWLQDHHWSAVIEFEKYSLYRGTWDFYFQYEEERVRMKVEQAPEGPQIIHKANSESLLLDVYKTIKDSLSIKSSPTTIRMDHLVMTRDEANSWIVNLYGVMSEPLLFDNHIDPKAKLVMRQRNSHDIVDYPLTLMFDDEKFEFDLGVNYKKLINIEQVFKQTWDCFLELMINGEEHLIRMGYEGESPVTEHSRIQFEAPHIYELHFYITINDNVSVRLVDLPIKRNVNHISFGRDFVYLEGYSRMDYINEDMSQQIPQLIVKRRESPDELVYDLNTKKEERQGYFRIKVPLDDMAKLEVKEKEIFDFYIRYNYKDQYYERKLGFQEYTYFKDRFLDSSTLKHEKVTKYYILLTPGGNIKIETFMLSKRSHYYMKYGVGLDRMFHRNKDIWLVGERYNTAQDTGYHFFKYCRENHPNLKIYYVIDRGAKDVENLKGLGNVVYSGTLKHARLSALANVFIGSHDLDYFLSLKGSDLDNYTHGKRVFLQHGVLGRKNVEYHKNYYQYPFHLFCVSSKPEKRLVQNKMNYNPDEVKVTGLARFDRLLSEHETKNHILFIPTWREWLTNEKRLKESIYFDKYQSLLNNPKLHELLDQYDMTLNFYPHYRMQPYVREFQQLHTDRVKVIELGERNVQDLLMESKLMITDYSSVSFDFTYMSKPVVFYHFDSATFFKNGMLRPIKETFLGDVCKTEDEVIQSIEDYMKNGFREKERVNQEKKHIFSKIDQKNNKRIFDQIKKI